MANNSKNHCFTLPQSVSATLVRLTTEYHDETGYRSSGTPGGMSPSHVASLAIIDALRRRQGGNGAPVAVKRKRVAGDPAKKWVLRLSREASDCLQLLAGRLAAELSLPGKRHISFALATAILERDAIQSKRAKETTKV